MIFLPLAQQEIERHEHAQDFAAYEGEPHAVQMAGITITQISGSTSERMKEMAADTAPSLSAVKKQEVYMLNHITRNGTAQMRNALVVTSKSAAS